MKCQISHKGKSGIYCITNKVNNKVYVGKALCIYRRIKHHIGLLNMKHKDENRHLINSWHKYGRDSFDYKVLEFTSPNEGILKERELFWINQLKCTDHKYGYNMRIDSSTGMVTSDETRKKLSEAQKKRFKDPLERLKSSHPYWKNNPKETREMAKKVSSSKTLYKIEQIDKSGMFIRIWDSMMELLIANPTFKRHNIYAVCSGEKPSMYGFIWKRVK